MAVENKVVPPAVDTAQYFIPSENCTVILPDDYDRETKQHATFHQMTLKKGVVYRADKPYEVELCKKRKFKQVSKPKDGKVEDLV